MTMRSPHVATIRTESIGRPACVSTLARMMLRLHQQQVARQRLQVVRPVQPAEALKRDCGMDPESMQAVRNAQYQA